MLESVKLELGFALGLFAIFAIIRYRTDSMPIKEMTYLFVVITMSVINALSTSDISYTEVLLANMLILGVTYGLEKIWLLKNEITKVVVYEKIEMILPQYRDNLKADLELRTGLQINKIEIGNIDFVKNKVMISIYYYENGRNKT
jgi:hypothetical protein